MFEKLAINMALEKAPEYLWNNIAWGHAVLLTLLSLAVGALWHTSKHPLGQLWAKENYPNGILQPRRYMAGIIFGLTALSHFVLFVILSAVASGHGAGLGFKLGFGISVTFVLSTLTPTYLFANRSWKLLLADWGYYALVLSLAGLWLGSGQ